MRVVFIHHNAVRSRPRVADITAGRDRSRSIQSVQKITDTVDEGLVCGRAVDDAVFAVGKDFKTGSQHDVGFAIHRIQKDFDLIQIRTTAVGVTDFQIVNARPENGWQRGCFVDNGLPVFARPQKVKISGRGAAAVQCRAAVRTVRKHIVARIGEGYGGVLRDDDGCRVRAKSDAFGED